MTEIRSVGSRNLKPSFAILIASGDSPIQRKTRLKI